MNESDGWRLQLAYGGLHPDTTAGLLDAHGPEGAVSRVLAARTGSHRSRQAVAVPAAQRLAELAACGFRVLLRGDDEYPARLAALPDAPDLLFVTGEIPSASKVAVVGTRRCSPYGRNLAEAYGRA